jgi:hypothetical protein
MFELCQIGAPGAEVDGLEDTQQADDTDGEAPHQPVQVDDLHLMSS